MQSFALSKPVRRTSGCASGGNPRGTTSNERSQQETLLLSAWAPTTLLLSATTFRASERERKRVGSERFGVPKGQVNDEQLGACAAERSRRRLHRGFAVPPCRCGSLRHALGATGLTPQTGAAVSFAVSSSVKHCNVVVVVEPTGTRVAVTCEAAPLPPPNVACDMPNRPPGGALAARKRATSQSKHALGPSRTQSVTWTRKTMGSAKPAPLGHHAAQPQGCFRERSRPAVVCRPIRLYRS